MAEGIQKARTRMARIRTIKPEFWQDEDLAEVSEPTLILAAGLLNHSDDEGYFRAHPGLIKAAVFPLREPSMNIHGMLTELSNVGYIRLFEGADGKQYGQIINFTKHQRINRPSESKIRELEKFTEHSVKHHGGLTPGKEQGTGKGSTSDPSGSSRYPEEFELAWKQYPKRNGSNPKAKAYKAWCARLKEGHSVQEMAEGAKRYAEWAKTENKIGTGFVQQGATFFGPSKSFLEEWGVQAKTDNFMAGAF